MGALRVRRNWTAANLPNGEGPLFRELSRVWEPLATVTHDPVPMPLAVPVPYKPRVTRKWFASKRKAAAAPKLKPAWTPWLWTKAT
jgi:hypothetical protein